MYLSKERKRLYYYYDLWLIKACVSCLGHVDACKCPTQNGMSYPVRDPIRLFSTNDNPHWNFGTGLRFTRWCSNEWRFNLRQAILFVFFENMRETQPIKPTLNEILCFNDVYTGLGSSLCPWKWSMDTKFDHSRSIEKLLMKS